MRKSQALVANLKKLPKSRQAQYLKKLMALRKSSSELGIEPTKPATESDWTLDLANWLDSVYTKAADAIPDSDEISLALANSADRLYTAVADEAKKVPQSVGKGAGDLLKPLTGGDYLPYLIGAGATFGVIYYLGNVLPKGR